MPKNRFFKGMHILYNGREYVMEDRLPNNDFQIKDIITNNYFGASEEFLINSWFDGQLEFLGDTTTTYARRKAAKSLSIDLGTLDDKCKKKRELKRRYAYVSKVIDLIAQGVEKINDEILEPLIDGVHAAIKDPKKKPNWKTVYYEWCKTYLATGEEARALIPRYDKCGNYSRKFRPKRKAKYSEKDLEKAKRVADIIDEVINEKFLNPQRLTVKATHDEIVARVADENSYRTEAEELPTPSLRGIYDVVSLLDEYEVIKARWGKRIADLKCGVYKRGPRPTRPLERVEIDHTRLDLFVIDPITKMPIGRPTLTLAIDRYTRMILGFYISFNGPGFLAVSHCLRHAILPKTYVQRLFPDVKHIWKCYGIPELVVIDNGPEFHGDGFEDACLQIGFAVMYCPVKCPWFKAVVERYFRTLNQELLHQQPGTTFSNIIQKEDYDPAKNAIITLDSLLIAVHVFIIDYYSQRRHRGINDVPALRWETAAEKYPPTLPTRREDLHILLGEVEYRTIQSNGISLFSLVYNDTVLARLRKGRKGYEFKIKYDPADISVIYVQDPDNEKFVPVPAEDQSYAKGLSLWQHKVIQRVARKKYGDREVTVIELSLTKRRITNIIWRDWLKIKKTGPRSKMARFLNISQPDYSRHVTEESKVPEETERATQGVEYPTLAALAAHAVGQSDIESAFRSQASPEGMGTGASENTLPSVLSDGLFIEHQSAKKKKTSSARRNKATANSVKAGSGRGESTVVMDHDPDELRAGDELIDGNWRTAVLPRRSKG